MLAILKTYTFDCNILIKIEVKYHDKMNEINARM